MGRRRVAANAGYKIRGVTDTRRIVLAYPPLEGDGKKSHRHFAVPHRRAGGQAFRGVDDGVGVDAVVAIEVIDGPGLAEMFDTERFDAVAVHAAEPAERGRMAVDHGHDAAVARKRRKQFLDMAEMRYPAAVAPQLARRGPSGKQPVGRGDRQQTDVAATLTQ